MFCINPEGKENSMEECEKGFYGCDQKVIYVISIQTLAQLQHPPLKQVENVVYQQRKSKDVMNC